MIGTAPWVPRSRGVLLRPEPRVRRESDAVRRDDGRRVPRRAWPATSSARGRSSRSGIGLIFLATFLLPLMLNIVALVVVTPGRTQAWAGFRTLGVFSPRSPLASRPRGRRRSRTPLTAPSASVADAAVRSAAAARRVVATVQSARLCRTPVAAPGVRARGLRLACGPQRSRRAKTCARPSAAREDRGLRRQRLRGGGRYSAGSSTSSSPSTAASLAARAARARPVGRRSCSCAVAARVGSSSSSSSHGARLGGARGVRSPRAGAGRRRRRLGRVAWRMRKPGVGEQRAEQERDEDAPLDADRGVDRALVPAVGLVELAVEDEEHHPQPGGHDHGAVAARQVERAAVGRGRRAARARRPRRRTPRPRRTSRPGRRSSSCRC